MASVRRAVCFRWHALIGDKDVDRPTIVMADSDIVVNDADLIADQRAAAVSSFTSLTTLSSFVICRALRPTLLHSVSLSICRFPPYDVAFSHIID